MDFENYTDRAKGFIQSAQSLALRESHQKFIPSHILKVLLDDDQGLASGLIDRAGGASKNIRTQVEAGLDAMPKVSGSGAGQLYLDASTARVFETAKTDCRKSRRQFCNRRTPFTGNRHGKGQ